MPTLDPTTLKTQLQDKNDRKTGTAEPERQKVSKASSSHPP